MIFNKNLQIVQKAFFKKKKMFGNMFSFKKNRKKPKQYKYSKIKLEKEKIKEKLNNKVQEKLLNELKKYVRTFHKKSLKIKQQKKS